VIKPHFLPAAEAELLNEVAYYSNVRDGLGVTQILIVAVMHHRRKPGYWADRIA
jgi:hypothetical protein